MLDALFDAGHLVVRVNARRCHAFVAAIGLPANTDRLDAADLACIAGTLERRPSQPMAPWRRRLRACVRDNLYMACLSAIQHEPRIREFYRSLRVRETPDKVAVVAAMRKMRVILNARAREAQAVTT
nr:hypothetical protein [Xanthomonas populi]